MSKVHCKTSFSITRGAKTTMSREIIETIHVLGLQKFINYERMNPIEVSHDLNDIIERLTKCKQFKNIFLKFGERYRCDFCNMQRFIRCERSSHQF